VISLSHLGRVLAGAGLSFQRTRSRKSSPDPDYETKVASVLELYSAAPVAGPVITFDQIGRSASSPSRAPAGPPTAGPSGCAWPTTASTASATSFGALDVHRDRLYAQMRPRRAGIDILGFMQSIRPLLPLPAADLLDPRQPLGELDPRHPRVRS
jgi:hypothetical protein